MSRAEKIDFKDTHGVGLKLKAAMKLFGSGNRSDTIRRLIDDGLEYNRQRKAKLDDFTKQLAELKLSAIEAQRLILEIGFKVRCQRCFSDRAGKYMVLK